MRYTAGMSTAIGKQAEEAAAYFLQQQGFQIITQNWRTRWCEIDIVACRKQAVHFIEVKYRHRATWGDGLSYITPRKLTQMQFAASFWAARYSTPYEQYLSAISLSGTPPEVDIWIPIIE